MWQKIQDNINTGKKTKIIVDDFYGIEIIRDVSISIMHNNPDSFLLYLAAASTSYGGDQKSSISGDFFRFTKGGGLVIKNTPYSITDIAFGQILDYFNISRKQIKNLDSSTKLRGHLNKLFLNSYDTKFYIKIANLRATSNSVIVGFHSDKIGVLPPAYNIFTRLLKPSRMATRETVFNIAMTHGHASSLYLAFSKQSKLFSAVEISYSPTGLMKPNINAVVFCDGAIIINKESSFVINPETMGLDKYGDLMETLISNVKLENKETLKLIKKAKTKVITPSLNEKIKNRVKKSVGKSKFDFLGLTLYEAIVHIGNASGKNEKNRRTSMFLGDLLTF